MNKDILNKVIIFVTGASLGSLVTWKLVKTKYEQIAQEEIDSVKEVYANQYQEKEHKEEESSEEHEEHEEEDSDTSEYEELVEKTGYAAESEKEEEAEKEMNETKPYVISPEEFGDSDYPTVTLWYYLDGTVTNDRHKIVSNVEELVGKDFADHFGDYEYDPDAVYVRNDEMEVDYEILKDYRDFSEVS